MERIAVLMSTYNGEKYIEDQINSIINQKNIEVSLYVRDDGSKDRTVKIVKELSKKHANIELINDESDRNLGFNGSFIELIKYAYINADPQIEFFAFADQDDVWTEDKCFDAVSLIKKTVEKQDPERTKPIYYYSNKYWCDEHLNIVHEDDMSNCKDNYFDMFFLPPVYGCTSVFNRILAKMIVDTEPDHTLLYDVYMFRLVCLLDGIMISDKKPHMYYRRHGNNASGDAMKFSILSNMKKLISGKENFHGVQKYVEAIFSKYNSIMPVEQKKLATIIVSYTASTKSWFQLLTWKMAYKRGIKNAVIWIGRVMTRTI